MVYDFMYKTGRLEPVLRKWLYSDYDLCKGISYCRWLQEMGYKKEPFYDFNLNKFIKWANTKFIHKLFPTPLK